MPSFKLPPDDVADVLQAVLKKHHTDLLEVDVRIQVLASHAKLNKAGFPTGEALLHRGYPALAVVSLFSLKDRVGGSADARIVINGDAWAEHSPEKKESLLHHECLHLELIRDDEGNVELDDACRPKLKLRPHDFEAGIFWEAVKNYGDDSCEAESWKPANRKMTQMLLPFDQRG